jgi:hypothetical protein
LERKIDVPEKFTFHITITAVDTVASYYKEKRGLVMVGEIIMTPLKFDGKVPVRKIVEWLNENDEMFQKVVEKSDEYAVIDEISSIRITYKLVPIAGRGFVILINPERFPKVKSSTLNRDCLFDCYYEAGLKFKSGYTLHDVKEKLEIYSFVSVKKISETLEYLSVPVQVIIHNVKDG